MSATIILTNHPLPIPHLLPPPSPLTPSLTSPHPSPLTPSLTSSPLPSPPFLLCPFLFFSVQARDIIQGMCYLHSFPVLHRALRPQNILLGEHLNAKISDFGFHETKKVCGYLEMMKSKCKELSRSSFPVYTAPEIFERNEFSTASDVYSFGMFYREVITIVSFIWRVPQNDLNFVIISQVVCTCTHVTLRCTCTHVTLRCTCTHVTLRCTCTHVTLRCTCTHVTLRCTCSHVHVVMYTCYTKISLTFIGHYFSSY